MLKSFGNIKIKLNVEIIYGHASDNEKSHANKLHFQMHVHISKYNIFKCTYIFIILPIFMTYNDILKSSMNIPKLNTKIIYGYTNEIEC